MTIITVSGLLAILGAFLVYDGYIENKMLKKWLNDQISHKSTTIKEILNSGFLGEQLLSNHIAYMRRFENYFDLYRSWAPIDDQINSIVLARNNFSQEVDNLLLIENNLYVFEVKHWRGSIYKVGDQLYQNSKPMKSLEDQTNPKVRILNDALNEIFVSSTGKKTRDELCEIKPVYVFTHEFVELDENLPRNYIYLKDLVSFFRLESKHALSACEDDFEFHEIQSVVKSLLDKSEHPKLNHMLKLAESKAPPKDARTLKTLVNDINLHRADLIEVDANLQNKLRQARLGAILIAQFLLLKALSSIFA